MAKVNKPEVKVKEPIKGKELEETLEETNEEIEETIQEDEEIEETEEVEEEETEEKESPIKAALKKRQKPHSGLKLELMKRQGLNVKPAKTLSVKEALQKRIN